MAKKGVKQKKYSAEFKISVILDMREQNLGYNETLRKYGIRGHETLYVWERIYREEGAAGFYKEKRGRKRKVNKSNSGGQRKELLGSEEGNDLIAENQRLKEQLEYAQMEIDYLKKLDALVRKEKRQKNKKQ